MKICLITETFPPEINGVAMSLHQVVVGMIRRGHAVSVVAPRRKDRWPDSSPFPIIEVSGLPVPRYDGLRFGLPAYRKLRQLWQASRPDVVHVATEGPLGWSAVRAAEAEDIPLVSSFHTNFHEYGSHYGYSWLGRGVLAWLRHIHNRTRLTFAPSAELVGALKHAGFRNLQLMGRGVDTDLFGPHQYTPELREAWGVNADTPVALYVGRVAPEKNIELSIRAYRAMRQHLPQLRMVVVGDGPARRSLESQHPDVHFAGMRRGEDLARHYASADCFLFASKTETFGNVVTEAMASGLVVLAYNYAAPAAYIRNRTNGYTAAFDDSEAYVDKSRQMAANRDRWPTIRSAAVETMRPVSWDAIIDGYEQKIKYAAIDRDQLTILPKTDNEKQKACS